MSLILIVDDSEDLRELVTITIGKFGFETAQAGNGIEAMTMLVRGLSVDLVLSDIKMPSLNGFELAKLLKLYYPKIPICLMTGYPESLRKARMSGFHTLEKPFEEGALIEAVRMHLFLRGV